MIISHDRQTLFIGVPKNGSQTARAVLGQIGIDLVGEMGRHPTVPEAIRLAEERFPGEAIVPTAIYAFWRDPVERFCSAVEFHKRCLPNSFIQLFPERFVGIAPHNRWFEPDPEAVDRNMRTLIDSILPIEILAALPPPSIPGTSFRPRGGRGAPARVMFGAFSSTKTSVAFTVTAHRFSFGESCAEAGVARTALSRNNAPASGKAVGSAGLRMKVMLFSSPCDAPPLQDVVCNLSARSAVGMPVHPT